MRIFRAKFAFLLVAAVVAATSSDALASSFEVDREKDIRWRGRVIRLGVSTSFFSDSPAIKVGSDVRVALARSIERWETAANVRFELFDSTKQNVSPGGNYGDGISLLTIAGSAENILFLGKSDSGLPAATRVYFDRRGNITEADIVLSPTEQFSTDGTFGTFDLESVIVHEIGHLLGLRHIELPGTTMYDSVPRNGLYGLSYLRLRTLTESDVSAVREIYGEPAGAVDCCGSVLGTITHSDGLPARSAEVILESVDDGRIFGLGKTDGNGNVYFGSVPSGNYRFATASVFNDAQSLDRLLAESIEVVPNEESTARLTIDSQRSASNRILIGFNGQLSNAPIPLMPGGASRIYLGVPEKFVEGIWIASTSSKVSIVPDSILQNTRYEGLRVISVEIEIGADASDGEYSLVIGSDALGPVYLPGVLSIDRRMDRAQFRPARVFE